MFEFPGNLYSRGHLPPHPNPTEFWDFSWDEMAEHDLPAMLGHMMKVTSNRYCVVVLCNYFCNHAMAIIITIFKT